MEVINALMWRVLAALKDDDSCDERVEYVGRLQERLIRYNDGLVNSSFISWSDWELWNAVYRVWATPIIPANLHLDRAFEDFILTRIREERDRTGSTTSGVVEGVARTGAAPTARPSSSSAWTSRRTSVFPSSAVEWWASAYHMSSQIDCASLGLGSPPNRCLSTIVRLEAGSAVWG